MKRTDYQLPRWAAGLVLAALPMIGLASAPASVADDFDCIASVSLDCMMNDDDGFSDGGGFQPGDLVLPATGGPQVAVAPAPAGGPVVTAGGGVVIPGAPPIG